MMDAFLKRFRRTTRRQAPSRFRIGAVALLVLGLGASELASSQVSYQETKGKLPDRGTTYLIRVPSNWNGTVISDLDYATYGGAKLAFSDRYDYLLNQGYALSGTARREDRRVAYDPAHELVDLINVLDIFESRYGKPKRILSHGLSGGGHVAIAMAEEHPDRIDGAIATCAHGPVWLQNTYLDGFFVLKALLAPNLAAYDIPDSSASLAVAWRQAVLDAQKTPEGRARLALAVALGQWPVWSAEKTQEPDPNDMTAMQNAIFEGILAYVTAWPGGVSRFMFERRGQLSWNKGIDYKELYKNADPLARKVVEAMYREAKLNLQGDFQTLDAFPRVSVDPKALKHWSAPGRAYRGEPKIPLLRIHTSGDMLAPPSLVQGYSALVQKNGYSEFYRTAMVRGTGHCTFTVAEIGAAVETMMKRLDTGKWPATDPDTLNRLGTSLAPASPVRYFNYDTYTYNRTWLPNLSTYLGLDADPRNTPMK